MNDVDTLATALYAATDDVPKEHPDLAPCHPPVGITPRMSDAEPVTLATMQAILGYTSETWDAVRAFEAEHGIAVPEPYRTFVAEISGGSFAGPPDFGLLDLARMPADWGAGRPERHLAQPFPLRQMWIWEEDPRSDQEIAPLIEKLTDHGSIVWAPMAAACTGT